MADGQNVISQFWRYVLRIKRTWRGDTAQDVTCQGQLKFICDQGSMFDVSSRRSAFAREDTQHHLHLRWGKRLWKKNRRPRRNAVVPNFRILLCTDHTHWYVAQSFVCFHIGDKVQSQHVRHHHVEDGGAKLPILLQNFKSLLSICHRHRLITLRLYDGAHHPQRQRIVISDKDSPGGRHLRCCFYLVRECGLKIPSITSVRDHHLS